MAKDYLVITETISFLPIIVDALRIRIALTSPLATVTVRTILTGCLNDRIVDYGTFRQGSSGYRLNGEQTANDELIGSHDEEGV